MSFNPNVPPITQPVTRQVRSASTSTPASPKIEPTRIRSSSDSTHLFSDAKLIEELKKLSLTVNIKNIQGSPPEELPFLLTGHFYTGGALNSLKSIIHSSRLHSDKSMGTNIEERATAVLTQLQGTCRRDFCRAVEDVLVGVTPQMGSSASVHPGPTDVFTSFFREVQTYYTNLSALTTSISQLKINTLNFGSMKPILDFLSNPSLPGVLTSDIPMNLITSTTNLLVSLQNLEKLSVHQKQNAAFYQTLTDSATLTSEFLSSTGVDLEKDRVQALLDVIRAKANFDAAIKAMDGWIETASKPLHGQGPSKLQVIIDAVYPDINTLSTTVVHLLELNEISLLKVIHQTKDSQPDALPRLKDTLNKTQQLKEALRLAIDLFSKIAKPDEFGYFEVSNELKSLKTQLGMIYEKNPLKENNLDTELALALIHYFYDTKKNNSESYMKDKCLKLMSLCADWTEDKKYWLLKQTLLFIYPKAFPVGTNWEGNVSEIADHLTGLALSPLASHTVQHSQRLANSFELPAAHSQAATLAVPQSHSPELEHASPHPHTAFPEIITPTPRAQWEAFLQKVERGEEFEASEIPHTLIPDDLVDVARFLLANNPQFQHLLPSSNNPPINANTSITLYTTAHPTTLPQSKDEIEATTTALITQLDAGRFTAVDPTDRTGAATAAMLNVLTSRLGATSTVSPLTASAPPAPVLYPHVAPTPRPPIAPAQPEAGSQRLRTPSGGNLQPTPFLMAQQHNENTRKTSK
jgi:hypothetical protein